MATEAGHWITLEDGRHIFIGDAAGHVPSRLRADGDGNRFSKTGLERHLIAHHHEMTGGGSYTAHDEKTLNEVTGGDPFTFHKKLPEEVKAFAAGRPALRSLFRTSESRVEAGGDDAMGALGDRYFQIAEAKAGSPLRAAKETARNSNDPEVKFLAAVHDNLPAGKFQHDSINAGGLRVGDKFTIGGTSFRVAEDEQGMRVLEGGRDYPETPVDTLRTIPVDKGSFRPGKRQKMEAAPFSADGHACVFALSTPTATPVLALGSNLPTAIEGKPVYYRKKEIARAGHYVHRAQRNDDGTRREFDITPERMALWLDAFKRRKSAGITPFVPERHVEQQADARANMGYVIDLEQQGDSLYGTFQFIGDDALDAAARNDVSIYVIPDAVDAKGGQYEECIEHVCLTPNPAIPHLQPFVSIAASADQPAQDVPVFALAGNLPSQRSDEMDKKLIEQLRTKFGWGNDVPDEKIAELTAQKSLALSGDVQTLTTERDTLKSERDAAKDKVLSLSADLPKLPDPITLSMFAENISARRESAIRSGALTEAEAKTFDGLLADARGTPNALALSACGDDRKPFAFRFWDAVGKLAGGIRTGNAVPRDSSPASPLALSGDDKKDVVTPERMAELLAATPTGRAILADAAASAGKR